MAKVVDITDKLSFEENPKLKIKNIEVEVNTDAKTMLKIMGLFKNKSETQASLEALDLLIDEKDKKKLEKLNLSFKDYMTIIGEAMKLVKGEDEPGEQ